jgi:phage-related minor tail protein
MQAKSTQIAYLKRMLQRLDSQYSRIDALLKTGELTSEAAELGTRQLANERAKLLAELNELQAEN